MGALQYSGVVVYDFDAAGLKNSSTLKITGTPISRRITATCLAITDSIFEVHVSTLSSTTSPPPDSSSDRSIRKCNRSERDNDNANVYCLFSAGTAAIENGLSRAAFPAP